MNGIENENVIYWRGNIILTDEPLPQLAEALTIESYPEDVDGYYFVQFAAPVTRDMKEQILNTGAVLHSYVPNNAYIVRMNQAVKMEIEALPFVSWMEIYQPAYRLSPALSARLSGEQAAAEPRDQPQPLSFTEEEPPVADAPHPLLLTVQAFLDADLAEVEAAIRALGGEITAAHTGERFHKMRVSIAPEQVNDLASIEGVLWVEEFQPPELHNDTSRGIMNVAPIWDTYGLTGANQVIGVCDTGLDSGVGDQTMHPDFRGRIINIYPIGQVFPDLVGHGTHVAGSVLGSGSSSQGQYRGVAPDASLVFQSIGRCSLDDGCTLAGLNDYPALGDIFKEAFADGARIHSNSWGAPVNGAYTTEAEEVDTYLWQNQQMLVLFSSGNSGIDANQDDTIDPGSVGSPGTAKNVLTVGASENDRPQIPNTYSFRGYGPTIDQDRLANNPGGLAAFSSRGPTDDWRIKPDVVAPGTMVISARSRSAANTIHFQDDMEAGAANWSADQPWARVSGAAHAGSWCWHSNPGGSYQPNANVSLTSVPLNLSAGGPKQKDLQFWCRYDLPDNGDIWRLEVSRNGSAWYGLDYQGTQNDWEFISLSLGEFSYEPALRIRFRLRSNANNLTGDGLFIDDVRIVEGAFSSALLSDFDLAPANSQLDRDYQLMNGTSMATPLTAGAAALVRQYFTQKVGFTPSAPLIRAALINGAAEMSPGQYGPGVEMGVKPNHHEGWGRVDLQHSIMPALPHQLDFAEKWPGLETEDRQEYYLNVVDNTVPLTITMVYHDYPGAGLVNRLNLQLIPPGSGQTIFPNGRDSADNLNNVQQIHVDEPLLGMYTVRIDGANVPEGPQPFALATLAGGRLFDWPLIEITPARHDFGNIRVGSTAAQRIEIRNKGERPLAIADMEMTGADFSLAADYVDPNDHSIRCGTTTPVIAPHGRCFVRVTYKPTVARPSSGQLKITSNDPYHPEVWASFSGTSLVIREPNIAVCQDLVDFGEHKIGKKSKPRFCHVANIGTGLLEARIGPVASLHFSLNLSGPFSPCKSAKVSLNPGSSCSFSIHFTPEHLGVHNGEIEIHSNDPDDPVTRIKLTGDGVL